LISLTDRVVLEKRGKVKNHIFKGVDSAKELVHSFDEVLVYFDPDVDGCIAGLLVCKYCIKHKIPFTWYINKDRSHDWNLSTERVSGKNIIAVDFIITAEKVIELCDAGCNLISMDHHVNRKEMIDYTSDYSTHGIVINNQYPFEDKDSRYLSGAGVVYESLIYMDPDFDTQENRALVGITLLSDVRDIENEYAQNYLSILYTHPYKGYIRYLIDSTMGEKDYGFGVPRMDRNYVDFKFSPAINAWLRFNHQDDVVDFFLGKNTLDLSYREEQKALVNSLMKGITVVDFSKLRVCYFYEKDFKEYADILSNFVGLVASRNLNGEQSVICYMIGEKNGKSYMKRASFRGNRNGLDYQASLGLLYTCLGHKSAFGIKGLSPKGDIFANSNELCVSLEEAFPYEKIIISTSNLSFFIISKARKIAEENLYSLSQNKTYVKYTGNSYKVRFSSPSFTEYIVDGITVKCFDSNMNPENSLITPTLERGFVHFYLE